MEVPGAVKQAEVQWGQLGCKSTKMMIAIQVLCVKGAQANDDRSSPGSQLCRYQDVCKEGESQVAEFPRNTSVVEWARVKWLANSHEP